MKKVQFENPDSDLAKEQFSKNLEENIEVIKKSQHYALLSMEKDGSIMVRIASSNGEIPHFAKAMADTAEKLMQEYLRDMAEHILRKVG